MLESALEVASHGLCVFPVIPATKLPKVTGWWADATTEPAKIVAWWTQFPTCSVGIACGHDGIVAIDIDGAEGAELWAKTAGGRDAPTLTSISGSGNGLHRIYRLTDAQDIDLVPTRRGAIGGIKGIDVRAKNGQIVAPGSIHKSGGRYQWLDPMATIAPMPDWLYEAIRTSEPRAVADASEREHRNDPPREHRIELAREHVRDFPPGIEDDDGSGRTIAAACAAVRGFDLDPEAGIAALDEFNARCQPPWSPKDLARKVTEAARIGTDPWGYLLEAVDMAAAFLDAPSRASSIADLLADANRPQNTYTTGLPILDTATRGGFRDGSLVVVGGAPGACKTALVTQWALDLARAGLPVFLLASDEPPQPMAVRIGQQLGLDRATLESGQAKEALRVALAGIPLHIFDGDKPENTITALAAALPSPGVLVVDSLQMARPNAGKADREPRTRIDATVKALKQAANGHVVITTSELSRGFYRSKEAEDQTNPLAAFKESGAIEYAGTLLLVLRTPVGEAGVVDVVVPKNRLGSDKPEFRLRLDPVRARLALEDRPEIPDRKRVDVPEMEHVVVAALEARVVAITKASGFTSVERLGIVLRAEGLRFDDRALRLVVTMLTKERRIDLDPVSCTWHWIEH